MSEECVICGAQVTKYIILEVSEFKDNINGDPEGIGSEDIMLCNDCWNFVKLKSSVLQKLLVRI